MKHASFTTTVMISLAVFLCLEISLPAWACTDCICVTDNTCSNDECDLDLTANCTRLEFTPECDGYYSLYAAVISCGNFCAKCYSCVNLFKLTGAIETWIANSHTNACEVGNCETTGTTSISLTSSSTYVLYVCKLYCADYEGVEDCEDCDASCEAVGCLSYGLSTMPCTP